jgi:putative transposase
MPIAKPIIWFIAREDERPNQICRAIAGLLFSFESPSAVQTALALRHAIWRKLDAHRTIFGIPEVHYTDNGSDVTSTRLEQVSADLKKRLTASIISGYN